MMHVWKRLTAAFMVMALVLSTLTAAAAAETVYGVCLADNVNVRKQGKSSAKIWFKVDEGHVAQIIGTVEEDGDLAWYKINTGHPVPNGHTYIGYISADYFRPMTQKETEEYLKDQGIYVPEVTATPTLKPTQVPSLDPTAEPTMRPSTDDALSGGNGYEGTEVVGARGKTLGGTNFRDLPSTRNGKIIGTIPGKTVIDILAVPAQGVEWYCVSYEGKVGFVHTGMVTLLDAGATVTPAPTEVPPEDEDDGHTEYKGTAVTGAKGKTLGTANFRTEPSTTTGKIITSIPGGTEIDINGIPLEGASDPWYRVYYEGRSGYVHAGMVNLTNPGAVPTDDPGFGTEVTDTWGEITADSVRLRTWPNTESDIIRKLDEGTEVEILTVPDQISKNDWYRVRVDGVIGYVQSNYVRVTRQPQTLPPVLPPEDDEDMAVTGSTGEITADGVNFRIGPSTETGTMGKLNRGTVVELLTIPPQVDGNHWYKVRYNKLEGYIQAPYIRVLTLDENYLPDPQKYGYAKLTEDSANLRLEPAGSTIITWKGKGSLLQIVGASELKSSFQWYPVYYPTDSTIYYVREDMIDVVMLEDGVEVTPTPEPESKYGYVITTTYGVNLRLKAGGESITQIPRKTILTCVGEPEKPDGSQYWWYRVKYNGMVGYVRGDCVKVCSSYGGPVSATATPKPTAAPDENVVYGYIRLIKTDVALRTFPLQSVQTRLPKGLILPVVAPVVPADTYGQYCWYYVRTADGRNGYIRGDCAVSCYPEGDEIPLTPTPKPTGSGDLVGATGRMLKNTNFREKPSSASGSAIMTVIKAGTVVQVLSIPQDTKYGWYKIRYNGKTGYVYGTLIEMVTYGEAGDAEETEKPSAFGYVMITDVKVNLRDGVDGLTLTQLDKGTVWPMNGITVTKNGVNWYPIRAKGYSGYVHEDYAFKLSPEQEDSYLNGGTVPSVTPAPEITLSDYLIITDNQVNLRESPSLDAEKLFQVDKGTVMRYLGKKEQGTVTWHNVVYEGQVVWVHEDYSRVMTQEEYEDWLADNPGTDQLAPMGYLRVKQDYSPIRNAANGKIILATVRIGTVLPYYDENIEAAGYRWFRVLTPGGEVGYIASTLVEKSDKEGDDLPTPTPDSGDSSSSASSSQQETDYTDLKQGSTGVRVTNLVTELINQGYYKGSVTSTYTSAVKAAVEAFQAANGLYVDGIAGDKTQHKLFGTVPIGTGDTTNLDFAIYPVEKIDWFTGGIQELLPRGANFKVLDLKTGIVWWAHRWAGSKHADIETLTAADTARLCKIYGVDDAQDIYDENKWERRPCLVTIGTRTFACSLDGMPHNPDGDTIPNNNMKGQICLHFTNSTGHSPDAPVSPTHSAAIEYAYNNCPAGQKK